MTEDLRYPPRATNFSRLRMPTLIRSSTDHHRQVSRNGSRGRGRTSKNAQHLSMFTWVVGLMTVEGCTAGEAAVPEPVPSLAVAAVTAIYLTADALDAAQGNGGGGVVTVGADRSILGANTDARRRGSCPGPPR